MNTVIAEFDKRCSEIEAYFSFLEKVIDREGKLLLPNNKTHKSQRFDAELQKMLKANMVLLLYNLVESSVRSAMIEIYDQISKKEVRYENVTQTLKSIWIEANYGNFRDKGAAEILQILDSIAADTLEITFDSKGKISGNVDARKIKELASSIGFSSRAHYSVDDGSVLLRIKSERNQLAHGEKSFTECGRAYTISDLREMKRKVITYLRRILLNIEVFLTNELFLSK